MAQGSFQSAFLMSTSQEARKAGQASSKSSFTQHGIASKFIGLNTGPDAAAGGRGSSVFGCGGVVVQAAMKNTIPAIDASKLMRFKDMGGMRYVDIAS